MELFETVYFFYQKVQLPIINVLSSNPSDPKIWPLLPFKTTDSKSEEEKTYYSLWG